MTRRRKNDVFTGELFDEHKPSPAVVRAIRASAEAFERASTLTRERCDELWAQLDRPDLAVQECLAIRDEAARWETCWAEFRLRRERALERFSYRYRV